MRPEVVSANQECLLDPPRKAYDADVDADTDANADADKENPLNREAPMNQNLIQFPICAPWRTKGSGSQWFAWDLLRSLQETQKSAFHQVCRNSFLGEHVTKHVRLESSIIPFTGSLNLFARCFIKVTICHVKQFWQQRENRWGIRLPKMETFAFVWLCIHGLCIPSPPLETIYMAKPGNEATCMNKWRNLPLNDEMRKRVVHFLALAFQLFLATRYSAENVNWEMLEFKGWRAQVDGQLGFSVLPLWGKKITIFSA